MLLDLDLCWSEQALPWNTLPPHLYLDKEFYGQQFVTPTVHCANSCKWQISTTVCYTVIHSFK